MPTPTHLDEIKGVVELIAEPEAAKPRKAGAAKGKAGANAGSNTKSKSNRKNIVTKDGEMPRHPKHDPKSIAESRKPKAAAAKAKEPKLQSSKRKGKGR